MKVEETKIKGVKILTPLIHNDSRGSFFETFKSSLFPSFNLPDNFSQDNQVISNRNVLRGLHYQLSYPQIICT